MLFTYIENNHISLEEYYLVTAAGLPGEDYDTFRKILREELDRHGMGVTDWEQMQIGATIGVHTGPYPLGVGLLKRCL